MKLKKGLSIVLIAVLILTCSVSVVFAKPRTNIKVPPSTPTLLTASNITTGDVTLSWGAVSNASGYKIYRATPNDSNYSLIATVSSTSYKNSGLASGTAYWYFVRAYNSYGTSADSTHIKAATLQPVQSTPSVSSKIVLGFTTYYYSGDSSSYNSMVSNTSTIDEIATHTYITDGTGNITGTVPTSQVSYANSNNIKAYVMVSNNFDGNIAKALLESSTNRQALINNTLNAIKTDGYKGVNIDFEGVFAADRSYLTTFMTELYNTLHSQGYTVTISLPAKTYDSTTDNWSGAYDYAALSNYADQAILMTYDEHYPGGTPGPVASIGWVQNVVNFAVTVIPKEKILLGTAAYGYDWTSTSTKAYSIPQIYNLASTTGSQIQWDSASQTPYFKYTDSTGVQHEVWFENAQSVAYKLDVVNNSNLAGIAIWRLGLEDSNYWTTIKTKFNR